MGKVILYTVIIVLFSACSLPKKEQISSISEYKTLLNRGYKLNNAGKNVFLHRDNRAIETCVYNVKPNRYTKKYINQFYRMLITEFRRFKTPVFVNTLKQCPQTSNIYVQVHEGDMTSKQQLIDYKDILFQKNYGADDINNEKAKGYNSLAMANFAVYVHNSSKAIRKVVGFVSFNQMSNYLDEKVTRTLLKSLIIEELFQSVTLGRDVKVGNSPMSKLQEKRGITISGKVDIEEFNNLNTYSPIALCSFDLWTLNLNFAYEKDVFLFKDFIDRFDRDYVKIEKQSLAIMNNPAYKGLFDPRCSGKNTGINTKIGIE